MKLPRWLRWRTERELEEEIRTHLAAEIETNLERGLRLEEAAYAARRTLGNQTRLKECAREGDPMFRLEVLAKDIRYAFRSLARTPGFAIMAVLSLALGIGANTAIFSLLDSILLRPLGVERGAEIVRVSATAPRSRFGNLSYREYAAYRDQNGTLDGLVAYSNMPVSLKTQPTDLARIAYGQLVSGNFLDVLGARPILGRTFRPDEDSAGASELVGVLSYVGWTARFQSDPGAAGRRVTVNGQAVTIVGVLAPEFTGTNLVDRPEVYLPMIASQRLFPTLDPPLLDPRNRGWQALGRLRPGVAVKTTQADLAAIASALEKAYPETNRERGAAVMKETAARLQQNSSQAALVYLLLGLVAVVLLIACTNVANMLLGRAGARTREIAIRLSVGASRGRLIAQLLTESGVLAVVGACAALTLASLATRFFSSMQFPSDFPIEIAARLDTRVLAYTLGATAISVLLFGLWPALRATRVDLVSPSKSAARIKYGSRNLLVSAQTALAAFLLVTAALFVRGFLFFSQTGPGIRIDNVLVATFNPLGAGYSEAPSKRFYKQLQQRLRALPGVVSVALASHVQLGLSDAAAIPAGREDALDPDRDFTRVFVNRITPEYFVTTDTAILKGRAIDDRDREDAPGVVVVNETLAHRFWPETDAIGRRIRLGGSDARVLEVVGIARDGKYDDLNEPPTPYMYVPYAQQFQFRMSALIHTAGDPVAVGEPLRSVVRELGADVPVYDLRSMRATYEGATLIIPLLLAELAGALGLIGLSLAVAGLYAVGAFVVSRRTREIGIRMSLGASPGSVLRGVLSSGLKIAAAGVAVGLAAALALTQSFRGFLGPISPRDPATFAVVAILLLGVTLAACWIPARRASLVDPAVTLREE